MPLEAIYVIRANISSNYLDYYPAEAYANKYNSGNLIFQMFWKYSIRPRQLLAIKFFA